MVRGSRRECAWAVGELSRYQSSFGYYHVVVLEYCCQYLMNTIERELHFRSGYDASLPKYIATCDASYGSDMVRGRTHWGGAHFFLGCVIAVCAKIFGTIPLSTCEAEFMGIFETAREGRYLVRHVEDLTKLDLGPCVYALCDGKSAVYLSTRRNLGGGRSRHMDTRYHWIMQ